MILGLFKYVSDNHNLKRKNNGNKEKVCNLFQEAICFIFFSVLQGESFSDLTKIINRNIYKVIEK